MENKYETWDDILGPWTPDYVVEGRCIIKKLRKKKKRVHYAFKSADTAEQVYAWWKSCQPHENLV
jgi:hypothetical protein